MRQRRAIVVFVLSTIVLVLFAGALPRMVEESLPPSASSVTSESNTGEANPQPENQPPEVTESGSALAALETLEVKGRAAKTGYSRAQFGDGWALVNGCSARDIILHRDLADDVVDENCKVVSGTLQDPYSGESIVFTKAESSAVQIDHVVALSDAWQKGAQQLSRQARIQLANDPLELLAVSGAQNQAKSDSDAASWLPKNKAFRCEYVARQIAVKKKYALWVTQAEKEAMVQVLSACPTQLVP